MKNTRSWHKNWKDVTVLNDRVNVAHLCPYISLYISIPTSTTFTKFPPYSPSSRPFPVSLPPHFSLSSSSIPTSSIPHYPHLLHSFPPPFPSSSFLPFNLFHPHFLLHLHLLFHSLHHLHPHPSLSLSSPSIPFPFIPPLPSSVMWLMSIKL